MLQLSEGVSRLAHLAVELLGLAQTGCLEVAVPSVLDGLAGFQEGEVLQGQSQSNPGLGGTT